MRFAARLLGRKGVGAVQPRPSPAAPDRADQPDLAGRRAFLTDHVLLHTHIPKTAGSSLSAGLQAIVGGVNAMDLRLMRNVPLDDMNAEDLAGLSLVSGHFAYGVHKRFRRVPLYFAAVREPVERAVSNYRFLLEHRDHEDHRTVATLDFADAYDALARKNGVRSRNAQARVIMGGAVGPIDRNSLFRQVDDVYFLIIPQAEMNRTLNALRAAFGVPWNRPMRMNVSKGLPVHVSSELRARIRRDNDVDAYLYEHVVRAFDTRLAAACETIASHCLKPLESRGPQNEDLQ
ncbi:MAG: sulfotransferase family 2 domain-containing protein [Pseudomonadota bacterium]